MQLFYGRNGATPQTKLTKGRLFVFVFKGKLIVVLSESENVNGNVISHSFEETMV